MASQTLRIGHAHKKRKGENTIENKGKDVKRSIDTCECKLAQLSWSSISVLPAFLSIVFPSEYVNVREQNHIITFSFVFNEIRDPDRRHHPLGENRLEDSSGTANHTDNTDEHRHDSDVETGGSLGTGRPGRGGSSGTG
jgi:hypothetical protein